MSNRQKDEQTAANNMRSSYEEKITNFAAKTSTGKIPTPSRFNGSKTALSQYRPKAFNGSPHRIITNKNEVYEQLTGSARQATIQPVARNNNEDAQSIIS